jgi:hypothetical protein
MPEARSIPPEVELNRRTEVASRLSVALLFVAIAAAGCSQHGAGPGQTLENPALTPSAATPAGSPAPAAQPTPATQAAATGGAGAQATPDPVDTSISGLNQLLNGIDGSLSGSDAGASGGE